MCNSSLDIDKHAFSVHVFISFFSVWLMAVLLNELFIIGGDLLVLFNGKSRRNAYVFVSFHLLTAYSFSEKMNYDLCTLFDLV